MCNKKSLKDYVEIRKTLNERGEFNDAALIQAEENLERLKKEVRPALAKRVQELAAMGDFSENAEYQMAKTALLIDFQEQMKQLQAANERCRKGSFC